MPQYARGTSYWRHAMWSPFRLDQNGPILTRILDNYIVRALADIPPPLPRHSLSTSRRRGVLSTFVTIAIP